MQNLRVNNSIIIRIKNETLSRYYFYMNSNTQGDFQICISVPLNGTWYNIFIFFHSFLLKRKLWRFEILHESKWAYLPTVWSKYLKQGKEIKQNWTGEKKLW